MPNRRQLAELLHSLAPHLVSRGLGINAAGLPFLRVCVCGECTGEVFENSSALGEQRPRRAAKSQGVSPLTSPSSVSTATLMDCIVSHPHGHASTSGISHSPAERVVLMGGLSFGGITLLFVPLLHLSYGEHRTGNTSEGFRVGGRAKQRWWWSGSGNGHAVVAGRGISVQVFEGLGPGSRCSQPQHSQGTSSLAAPPMLCINFHSRLIHTHTTHPPTRSNG